MTTQQQTMTTPQQNNVKRMTTQQQNNAETMTTQQQTMHTSECLNNDD